MDGRGDRILPQDIRVPLRQGTESIDIGTESRVFYSELVFLPCCLDAVPVVHISVAKGTSLSNRICPFNPRLRYLQNISVGS